MSYAASVPFLPQTHTGHWWTFSHVIRGQIHTDSAMTDVMVRFRARKSADRISILAAVAVQHRGRHAGPSCSPHSDVATGPAQQIADASSTSSGNDSAHMADPHLVRKSHGRSRARHRGLASAPPIVSTGSTEARRFALCIHIPPNRPRTHHRNTIEAGRIRKCGGLIVGAGTRRARAGPCCDERGHQGTVNRRRRPDPAPDPAHAQNQRRKRMTHHRMAAWRNAPRRDVVIPHNNSWRVSRRCGWQKIQT